MRLSKLEIYGFKSFARRTEIVFPQNVTGIVGPNGSGKSNIGDAVRWVLGEQSAKTLRGNSMQDVIFNGTERRKAMNYCEVTLTFDNADHQLAVDYAEVAITRRVYRSGESEYLMNGAGCRLRDIVDMFRDTGVGKEGYSIIGQGRIDEILSQKSEDRRAIFEEAAGISRFRARKDEAEQRLKRADENLVRIVDVLDELERQLRPLEKQAEVAREYLTLSETLKELDLQLYLLRYDRQKKRCATVEEALAEITRSVEEIARQLAETTQQRDAQEQTTAALQQALSAAHDELLQKNELLHRARESVQSNENRLASGQETAERLQSEADAVGSRIRLIEATMERQGGGLDEADQLRDEAQVELERRKKAHAEAQEAAQKWEDDLSRHKSAILESMSRMQNVRTTQARQSAMHTQMEARRAELEAQLEGETAKEAELVAALDTAKENLARERTLHEQLGGEADAFEQRTKALLDGILEKQKSVQEAAQTARSIDARLKTLRELQDGYEGYQYPVRQALTWAKRSGLSGVRDVVAMLLSVPKELETAFDMALGGAMQNIVTDTEQDAKRLIDYLRQNRLGRATFLPLSTVRGRTLSGRERDVLSMPGCVGVASELCSYAPEYRPIFENLLGRTVVARDLDSGIAIMRAGGHAFRLVTLSGDVMHSGGSMTGGSIQQKAQNLLGRERELKELEAALAEKTELAKSEQEALTRMEQERGGIKEKRTDAQYALHQQEIAVVRDTERLSKAQSDLDEHSASAEGMRQAIAQLSDSIAQIEEELGRIQQQTDTEQGDADEMNARTEALSAGLDKARREREAAQEALTQAMLALQEAEHTCEQLRRDQKRLLGDVDECRAERQALLDKRERTLVDVEAAKTELEAARGAAALCEQSEAEARAHVEETELKQADAQKTLKDLQNELEAGQALSARETERLHRQELALARVKADLKQLDDRLWDTYELTWAGAQDLHAEYVLGKRAEAAGEAAEPQSAEAIGAEQPEPVEAVSAEAASDEANADEGEEAGVPAKPRQWFPVDPAFDETAADAQAQQIRDRIRQMGTVNVSSIEEYAKLRERFTEMDAQRDDLERAKADLTSLITRLLDSMRTVFTEQFAILQGYFAETFVRLFGGGRGEIALSDETDPLNCGIEIIVQPPGKKRQILSLFSGGERALTAIAILFAMLKLKPTPFCILDEIEAALDEANIGYFADYLKEFSDGTQFIVVTHRKGTMERCDTLFGVAMEEKGVSSMVSVNLTDYE
ncbi:MAG: chromosome segregation protein SMC [Eubacteriales bacterium]|nr:chromosome segregation protein SMC [Eubacteriales bacterium]